MEQKRARTKAKTKATAGVKTREKARVKPKAKPRTKPQAVKQLTAAQQQEKRSAAARKAALALWSQRRQDPDRPPSKKQLREQTSRLTTSQLSVDHYADRPNPKLSWAAAILKRKNSSESQRREAGRIVSESFKGERKSPWSKLPPEERSEIARRGGARRWEIWREEQAMLAGKTSKNSGGNTGA